MEMIRKLGQNSECDSPSKIWLSYRVRRYQQRLSINSWKIIGKIISFHFSEVLKASGAKLVKAIAKVPTKNFVLTLISVLNSEIHSKAWSFPALEMKFIWV